ncbi:MAG: hypothetical protein AAF086_00705 [Planctomycetota bacterium]
MEEISKYERPHPTHTQEHLATTESDLFENPPRMARLLLLVIVGLNLMNLFRFVYFNYTSHPVAYRLVRKFSFDLEMTVPAWFSTLLIAAAAWICTRLAYRAWVGRERGRVGWVIFAAGLWFVSVDENISIHEMLIHPMSELIGRSGVFYFGWIVVYVPLLLIFVWLVWPAVASMQRDARRWCVIAGVTFVGGAVGCEMVGGLFYEQMDDSEWNKVAYFVTVSVEESLEMVGMTFLIRGLMDQSRSPEVTDAA